MSGELPESAYPRCLVCGEAARPSPRVLHEVVGYTRPRSAGGANHIIARRETGRVVCAVCAEWVQARVPEGQGVLV
jgi:hypothetical protein